MDNSLLEDGESGNMSTLHSISLGFCPLGFTCLGSCLHLPLALLLCFPRCFFPMVCFKTGFQIGCVPSVEDYSHWSRASASWAAFLVSCGFSFVLALALGGVGNSGLQRVWQTFTGLWMLSMRPFSVPCHPEARATFRALWFNLRLLAQQCFKLLWAAC